MRNMKNLINKRHPNLALAAERISKACDEINKVRTFLPEDEKIVNEKIKQLLNDEVKIIGKKYIDIAPMTLEELALDKYAHIK